MLGQVHRINVYTSADDYTAPFNAEPLKCRVVHNTLNTRLQTLPVRERTEMLAGRRLQYPRDFDMPDNARVEWLNDPTAEGNSTFWSVIEETEAAWHTIGGRVLVNTCQLEKIDAGF
jgi:hypothetical protein